MLVRADGVLLQLRSEQIHHGGSWSVPGGAREFGESAVGAALREAREEIGLRPAEVMVIGEFVDDHGGWSYTTVVATPTGTLSPIHNYESTEVVWVPLGQVEALPLHPGFRASWPLLVDAVRELFPSFSASD